MYIYYTVVCSNWKSDAFQIETYLSRSLYDVMRARTSFLVMKLF